MNQRRSSTGRPAVFLDKDGTLVEDVPYNVDPMRMVLAPGAATAVQALASAGYALVVVSNQSGVARGLFTASALAAVESRLVELFKVSLDGFFYCPHVEDDGCACRKPQPGMLLEASSRLGLSLSASWMIGDILNDVEAGQRAKCRTILIDNGNETEWRAGPWRIPDFRVPDMAAAAAAILGAQRLAA